MPATALEQYILELINRARLDPAAEAARQGIALNEGVPAADTISTVSKQPLAMNEILLGTARTHSQDMINRDYFAHDTPEGVDPFVRMTNAGYNWNAAAENIAYQTTPGAITDQLSIGLHRILFVDLNYPGRGHRVSIMDNAYQEIGVGLATGNFQGSNAAMITEDFGTSGNQQFLTGVSYADNDHDNFYSIGEGRGSMSITVSGNGSTATGSTGGYSLAVGSGGRNITFSGGGLASPISVAVLIAAHTNAKVDVIDQGTIATSASLTDLGGATKIIGLGTIGLALTGDGGGDTIVGTKGNDTIDGAGGNDTAVFSGNFASYTLTNLAQGIRVVGPDGTDTVLNVENFQFADRTVNVGGSSAATHNDFNGDHMSDIVWRNDAGTAQIWSMNDATIHHTSPLGTMPASWTLAGTGDFNGDGKSDLLWRNEAAGTAQIWDMNDGAILHANSLGIIPASWKVLGVGDFNGDGMSDIVWRNNAGATSIWAMNDGVIDHTNSLGTVSSNWTLAGTGDFNGDGKSDLLWRNEAAGTAQIWDMNDGAILHANSLGIIPSTWKILGVGDFNGDHMSDIVWRNNAGATTIWAMNDGAIHHTNSLGTVPSNWNLAGTGDYNGDGKSDLLWRNETASAAQIWDMNDGAILHTNSLGVIPANWDIIA
ncbi:FG-GAP repeat protein [Bradyrhizobium lablabi]|uniref:FG-GAP-like repeat-containing protein n=1 Tax=Bradyrhizobium lablabi TaxID=722472 RepID=UPI001BA8ADDD|nr:FG-GAP-like repeat-containing protein [Bradyrhizobium lablabi]MBR1120290.1 FG-GAP repeat protein [Bradyrhizobium lablabi]